MADGNSSPASNTNGADNGNNNTPPPTNAMPAAMPDAMPPSPPPVEQQQIEINFNGSTGESVTFKLKNTTKLRKAMDAYSARVQRPVDQLRFLGRVHTCDRLFEFQIGFCIRTDNPDVEWFLGLLCRYCRGPTEQQYERK